MKAQAWWIVAMLATLTAPAGSAQEPESESESGDDAKVKIRIPPDLIQPCSWLLPGDQVGYDPQTFAYDPLGGGLHLARDTRYIAAGIFSGGTEETHEGTTYLVFTILSGFSEKADWCDRLLDPGTEPVQEPGP